MAVCLRVPRPRIQPEETSDPHREGAGEGARLPRHCAHRFHLRSRRSSSSTGGSTSLSGKLPATPGGVFLLIAVGIGIGAVGVYFVYSGITERFTKDIRVPAGNTGRTVVGLGRLGYIAKRIAVAVVGIVFVIAAATSESSKATGLDGALRSLRTLPFGAIILIVVGAGVIAYGRYCFARARLAKVSLHQLG